MQNLLSYHKAIFHIKLNWLTSRYLEVAEQLYVWRARYRSDFFCRPLFVLSKYALSQNTYKQAKPLQDHLLIFKYRKFANIK